MSSQSYSPFAPRIWESLTELGISGKIVVAVSGGADSMALLRALLEVVSDPSENLCVGHLDHGLRPDSADDATWLVEQGAKWGVSVHTTRRKIAEEAARSRRGIEETARRARYAWLAELAQQVDARYVLTAHTANDVSETILFNMIRGTGLAGLRGVAPRWRISDSVTVARPMLSIVRDEVIAYLEEIGQDVREDVTNADLDFTRNRLRHEILPALRHVINPRLDQALGRLANQARETQALLNHLAQRELRHCLRESGPMEIRLSTARLIRRRSLLVREVLRHVWTDAGWPRQEMTARHWLLMARIVREGGRRSFPGEVDVRRTRDELILRRPSGL